jgi:hypothetical protein
MPLVRRLARDTGFLVETNEPDPPLRKLSRCKSCERAARMCGVLVEGYCAECRQLPLPFREAVERVSAAELEAAIDRELDKLEAVRPPPRMCDLGWSCSSKGGEVWTHRSGARVEFRGSFPMGTRAARVNGGEWEPTSEMFWKTIDRALGGKR